MFLPKIQKGAGAAFLSTCLAFFVIYLSIGIFSGRLVAQQITSGFGAYRSLVSAHFRIHYPKGQRAYALRIAHLAEKIHARLEPKFHSLVGRTEVTLVFETDTINAFATSQGFDQIVLFLDNPQLGEFARYDSWVELLFVHEYTHILTIRDNKYRGNDLLYWLFGVPPNAVSPFGMLEGMAVWQESREGKGRLKDPLTEMTVRMALVEGRYPSIGEIMNGTSRWPYGTTAYLYGGRLWDRLSVLAGEEPLYRYWNRQGFPLDPNSRLPYRASLGKLYSAQRQADEKKLYELKKGFKEQGLTNFTRLTHSGDVKKFLIADDKGRLLFFARPSDRTPGLFSLKPKIKPSIEETQVPAKRDQQARLLSVPKAEPFLERRQFSSSGIAISRNELLLSEDYFFFSDFGLRHELFDGKSLWKRLAKGRNIRYPSLSSDGKILAYIERDKYFRYLKIERRRLQARVENTRLSPSGTATSASKYKDRLLLKTGIDGILQFTDISPDAKRLVTLYRNSDQGYAQLLLCRLQTENFPNRFDSNSQNDLKNNFRKKSNNRFRQEKLCHAILTAKGTITQPRFSRDGRGVYFSSDVDGIYNLYFHDIAKKESYRLTRTLGGFFYPTPSFSPTSKGLFAIAYFANGYDIVHIPDKELLFEPVHYFFNESKEDAEDSYFTEKTRTEIEQGLPQDSFPKSRPGQIGILPKGWADSSYMGLWEIRPYFTGFLGTFGNSFNAGFYARDPLLRHFALAGLAASFPEPVKVLFYDYTRYNLGLAFSYQSNLGKRNRNRGCMDEGSPFRFLCDDSYSFIEEIAGYLRYTGPGRYFSEQVLIGFAHKKVRNARRLRIVEYDTRDINLSGPSFILLAGDTRYFPKSISPELGWRLFLSSDYYTKPESKEFSDNDHRQRIEYGVAEGGLALYLPSFWAHHVNYLSAYGYTSYGPNREYQKVRLNRFVRGLAYAKAPSNHAASVLTYEYRFPIGLYSEQVVDSHPGSMVNNINIYIFADYGASFDRRLFREDWVLAYGVSLGFDLNIAYLNIPELRITWARGTGRAGEGQVYLSLTSELGFGPLNRSPKGSLGPDRRILSPYHRGFPGLRFEPGYFRNPQAGGILE